MTQGGNNNLINRLNTWVEVEGKYTKKTTTELDQLIEMMKREFQDPGDKKLLRNLSISPPNWDELKNGDATAAVNYLLSQGGIITDLLQIIQRVIPYAFPENRDWVKENGDPKEGKLIGHIKFMAGIRKPPPKTGLKFESSDSIEKLNTNSYVRAIDVWGDQGLNSKSPYSNEIKNDIRQDIGDYLPTKQDVINAFNILSRQRQEIPVEAVLDKIESNAKESDYKLLIEWRQITKNNIFQNWFKQTMGVNNDNRSGS